MSMSIFNKIIITNDDKNIESGKFSELFKEKSSFKLVIWNYNYLLGNYMIDK
jgi:hypothetical protein